MTSPTPQKTRPAYQDLTNLTPEDAQAAMKASTKKGHKYKAEPATYKGERYDSTAEANYAAHLDALREAGEIRNWSRGVPVPLVKTKAKRIQITYRPDFYVIGKYGRSWWVDVKGVLTPVFRLKLKLWRVRYPDADLRVINAKGEEVKV